MIYEKGKLYKLTEFRGGLVITDGDDELKDYSSKPLCIADGPCLLSYLDRYFYERERGCSLKTAHEAALRTAQLPTVRPANDD